MGAAKPFRVQALPGISSQSDLRRHVVERGCFDEQRNERIYRDWFANAPRYLFRAVDARYHMTDQTLCEVGSSYGHNLVFCTPESYGIEIQEDRARFATSIGLNSYALDLLSDDAGRLPPVDVVWCSAVLEHVDAPHLFLRRLHDLLKPGGLLALYVPTVPTLAVLQRLPRVGQYFRGHRAADHVNFFTPETLRWSCERSGFRTKELSPFLPGPLTPLNRIAAARRLFDGCVYIGTKIEGWDYPQKAHRRVERAHPILDPDELVGNGAATGSLAASEDPVLAETSPTAST